MPDPGSSPAQALIPLITGNDGKEETLTFYDLIILAP